MSPYLFTNAIMNNNKIHYSIMEMIRDFTYNDDIIDGVIRVIDNPQRQKYLGFD